MKFTYIVDPKVNPPANWLVICSAGVVKSGLTKEAAQALAHDLTASRNSELFVRAAVPFPTHLVRKAEERLDSGSKGPGDR